MDPANKKEKFPGGCHCGSVRFTVEADADFEIVECNCTICSKKGFLHLLVPQSRFQLLQGQDSITTYTFNTHVAKHYFCSKCGIASYYIPRSNPDGFSVNIRCLDAWDEIKVTHKTVSFDGQNWEANGASLAHHSKES